MANTFKSVGKALTNAAQTIYTCPSATTAIVILCQAANETTVAKPVTVQWRDTSASTTYILANAVSVPVNASLNCLAGKLALEAGDYIEALSDGSNQIELSVSVLEMT